MASGTGGILLWRVSDEKSRQAADSSCIRKTSHDVLFETKLRDGEVEL